MTRRSPWAAVFETVIITVVMSMTMTMTGAGAGAGAGALASAVPSPAPGGAGRVGGHGVGKPGAAPAASDVGFYSVPFEKSPSVAAMTLLGHEMFRDLSLSASGTLACASCHSPDHAFGPPNRLAVQRGGADGRRPGLRAVPSLMYAQNIPPFAEHTIDDEGDDSIDQGPAGGRTWDGRAQTVHDQARLPLLSPFEMANPSAAAVVGKVAHAKYAAQFRDAFGDRVFEDTAAAFRGVLMALETYQQSPAEFYPYSSKYDAWLRQRASLTGAETRGLEAFADPAKGNCARCHPSAMRAGAFPQFTDFGYAAIGAPRNAAIPANADPRYFDLGLCGPLRTDLEDRKDYCGLFRTPSLRNVARRPVFFHNGVFHRLEDVVRFYAERDTSPRKWYPRAAGGAPLEFDDLPEVYWDNLDRDAPLDRHRGDRPSLSEGDIKDIVAFLNTLTDGYEPGDRTARGVATQCGVSARWSGAAVSRVQSADTPASSVRLCARVSAMNSRM